MSPTTPIPMPCPHRVGVLDTLLYRLAHGGERTLRCWRCRTGRLVRCERGRHHGRGPLRVWRDADDERLPKVVSCTDCFSRGNRY